MKQRIIAILLVVTVAFNILPLGVSADTDATLNENDGSEISVENISKSVLSDSLIVDIGSMSVKHQITINGVAIDLYRTFDSNEDAIGDIYAETRDLLNLVQSTYGYEAFSDETWEQYQLGMLEVASSPDCPEWFNESNIQFRMLRQFFDIYENGSLNEEIIALAESASLDSTRSKTEEIVALLPYTSLENIPSITNTTRASPVVNGFIVDDGVEYAEEYAANRNSNYDSFGGDCANFASQILEAGGVNQEVYTSEFSGWWHTTSQVLFFTTHKHSVSWVQARTFATYMGVNYTTKTHDFFKINIQKGDFIAGDWESDGDWDHIAFVTDKNSTDYCVAQHTSDYNDWTSATQNHWEEVGADGSTYGRVRR